MSNLTIAGLPNYVDSPLATFATALDTASLPGSNLAGSEPSDVARLTAQDPSYAAWEIDIGAIRPVRRVAIINHTMVPGSSVRFIGTALTEVSPSAVTWTSEIAPDVLLASANLSGTLGTFSESPEVST
jgi:hypothetical protein